VRAGLPVQPHQVYEEIDGITCNAKWVDVPELIHSSIGLQDAFQNINALRDFFRDETVDEDDDNNDGSLEPFVPSSNGYEHELPDGVVTSACMRLVNGEYIPRWCLPQLDIAIPAEKDLLKQAQKLVKYCGQRPHRAEDFSEAARGAFLSYATFYNILVKMARDDNDADAGAEYGISPWKLGMLAGSLLLRDIMWGVVVPPFVEAAWVIEEEQIKRAFRLMTILDGIRAAFRTNEAPSISDAPSSDSAVRSTDPDRELPDCPQVDNAKTTKIARRILSKAIPGQSAGVFVVATLQIWKIDGKKKHETRKIGKLTTSTFRDIAKRCPSVLGAFVAEKDNLALTIPEEPNVSKMRT
jgi:hypothetical protein